MKLNVKVAPSDIYFNLTVKELNVLFSVRVVSGGMAGISTEMLQGYRGDGILGPS